MAIKCTILLFAHAADAVGKRELSIELPDGATVDDAMAKLCEQYPSINAMRSSLAIAVNARYAKSSDIIPDGATIAVIPPVSGG